MGVGWRKGAPGFDEIRLIGGIACASSWVFLPVFASMGQNSRVALEMRRLKRSVKDLRQWLRGGCSGLSGPDQGSLM